MKPETKAFVLGRAMGLAQGGWPNDTLDSLEQLPDIKKELVDYLEAGKTNSNFGLATPMKEIIKRELGLDVEE